MKSFKFNLYILSLLFLCGLFTSCQFGTKIDKSIRVELTSFPYTSKDIRPRYWTTYYPFLEHTVVEQQSGTANAGCDGTLSTVRGLRDHGGSISDEAIRYDLDEMSQAGFEGALLVITLSDLLDEHRLSRIRKYFELSSSCPQSFRIGLYVCSNERVIIGGGNVAQYLEEHGVSDWPNRLAVSPNSQCLIVVFSGETISFNAQNTREESIYDLRVTGTGPRQWPLFSSVSSGRPALRNRFAWVRCADSGASKQLSSSSQKSWKQPRQDGIYLENALKAATKDKARIICIHSWNYIQDGSFLMPNNWDGSKMLEKIKQFRELLDKLSKKN